MPSKTQLLHSVSLFIFSLAALHMPSATAQVEDINMFFDEDPTPTAPQCGNDTTSESPYGIGLQTSVGEAINPAGDIDYFSFNVFEGATTQVITIESIGEVDLVGDLLNPSGEIIATNDDDGPGTNFSIIENLVPGTYTVRVQAYSVADIGNYEVAVSTDLSDTAIVEQRDRGCEFTPSSVVVTAASGLRWDPGQTIRIGFFSGTLAERNFVAETASEWLDFANLDFEFVNRPPTDIRINIDSSNNHWSFVGRGALTKRPDEQTMNLGIRGKNLNAPAIKGIVLHEFGHALGLFHEHQNPDAGLCWDKPVVYSDYQLRQGWSTDKVDSQVFEKYDSDEINYSEYDPLSIMHYQIERRHLTCEQAVSANVTLSDVDKAAIAEVYPSEAQTSNTSNTGSDEGSTSVFINSDAGSGGGGGCQYVAGSNHAMDPTLPISFLLSVMYLFRRKIRGLIS